MQMQEIFESISPFELAREGDQLLDLDNSQHFGYMDVENLPNLAGRENGNKKNETDEELNEKLPSAYQPAATLKDPNALSFRRWIKQAIQFVGNASGTRASLSSPEYLESAIKIAISLTEQIGQTEAVDIRNDNVIVRLKSYVHMPNNETPQKIDGIGAADDLADILKSHMKFVEQKLEGNESKHQSSLEDQDMDQQLKSFLIACEAEDSENAPASQSFHDNSLWLECQGDSIIKLVVEQHPTDMNAQLDSFLDLFDKAAAKRKAALTPASAKDHAAADQDQKPAAAKDHTVADQDEKPLKVHEGLKSPLAPVTMDETSTSQRNCTELVAPSQARDMDVDYLNIDYVEIQCPESRTRNGFGVFTDEEKAQQIHAMGLLFYELFSGGEIPPPTLHALASHNGAFISLSTMTLVEKSDDEGQDFLSNSKRHQGPSASEINVGLCQLSCEYLRLMGVTGPLSHLILNMLNTVYGDLRGKDSYSQMSDITADLRLMLSEPAKFLHGIDTTTLSSSGLQLNELYIPREDEFRSIKSCYHRSVAGSCEIAVIEGESGSGKSWLAQRLGSFITEDGGVFLSGKFDQMAQAKPFSALSAAFNQYCHLLKESKDRSWVNLVVDKLKSSLGRNAHHLIKMIPSLGLIFENASCPSDSSALDISCDNAFQRLHYLLCQFVEVITTSSHVSLTLFMDDVQWADEASITVINRLLRQGHHRFFFIGCCRDDEMESDHSFRKMLDDVKASGVNATMVKLNCLDQDTLNRAIANLLHLAPRLVRPLSDIVQNKTRGNILFVSQLMLSLHRDGLLRIDFDRQRWVWDEEKILSAKLPDNVALCFTHGIIKLPVEVQLALHTLAMFGASVKSEYLELLESRLGLTLLDPLEKAATKGLVNKLGSLYQFTHDRIQEATYKLIDRQVRLLNHMMYGKCLVQRSYETDDGDLLFLAVNQLNLACPSNVTNPAECLAIANHNMAAGKRAMSLSDFALAYSFFMHGISFLDKDHWRDQYRLSIDLYELAIRSASNAGNIQAMNTLSEEVLQNARIYEDKLTTFYVNMLSLFRAGKVLEAVEKGLAIVSQLGEGIPINPSNDLLRKRIQQTQLQMIGMSEEVFLNYPVMTDFKRLMAMKFLARLQIMAFIINPTLSTYIVMKMVDLTLSHGLSPVAPLTFACFGSYLAKIGNVPVGYRFTSLARSLLDKLDAKEVAGEVILLSVEVRCFTEPMQALDDLKSEGEAAALSVGDSLWACLNRLQYCSSMFYAGTNLLIVYGKVMEARHFIKQQDENVLFFILVLERSLNILLGKEAVFFVTTIPRQKMRLSFHDLYLSLLFNDGNLKQCCEQFLESEQKFCALSFEDSVQAFCVGLASYQVYRQTRDPLWLDRASQRTQDMKLWDEQGSSWNFRHKLQLMQAEEYFSTGDFQQAKECYKNAIHTAGSHKFVNDEALSCELAARFYFETGDFASYSEHFLLAHKRYIEWGCAEKASRLFSHSLEHFASNYLTYNQQHSMT